MRKQKVYTEQELLLQEMADAKAELERVKGLFDFAEDVDLACAELTLAEMRFKLCSAKVRKFCTGESLFNLFYEVY